MFLIGPMFVLPNDPQTDIFVEEAQANIEMLVKTEDSSYSEKAYKSRLLGRGIEHDRVKQHGYFRKIANYFNRALNEYTQEKR